LKAWDARACCKTSCSPLLRGDNGEARSESPGAAIFQPNATIL
jgi:hypothetical protein